MPRVIDDAICVRHWDWSETSQTVSLFSRTRGVIRAVAKGAKREKAPFSGGIELLARAEMIAILKPGPTLATLASWDLLESFPALRRSLSAFRAGLYMADIVHHTITEHDPHPTLYDSFLHSLRALGDPSRDRLAVLAFQWADLLETGYRPELQRDAATGADLAPAATYGFSPRLGGFTTDPGASRGSSTGPPAWRVRAGTLAVLRSLDAAPDRLPDAAIPDDDALRTSRLLDAYLRETHGRPLPSAPFFLGGTTNNVPPR